MKTGLEARAAALSGLEHDLISIGKYAPWETGRVMSIGTSPIAAVADDADNDVLSKDAMLAKLCSDWGASKELIDTLHRYFQEIDGILPLNIRTDHFEYTVSSDEATIDGVVTRDFSIHMLGMPAGVQLTPGDEVVAVAQGSFDFELDRTMTKVTGIARCEFSALNAGIGSMIIEL